MTSTFLTDVTTAAAFTITGIPFRHQWILDVLDFAVETHPTNFRAVDVVYYAEAQVDAMIDKAYALNEETVTLFYDQYIQPDHEQIRTLDTEMMANEVEVVKAEFAELRQRWAAPRI
jgi:hypothetical protein